MGLKPFITNEGLGFLIRKANLVVKEGLVEYNKSNRKKGNRAEREGVMEERRKTSIRSIWIVLAGITIMIGIQMCLHHLEVVEQVEVKADIALQDTEEVPIELDMDYIYKKVHTTVEQESLEALVSQLVGGEDLQDVMLQEKVGGYGIALTYERGLAQPNLSKVKKDQLALINASALMSVYESVDVVHFMINRGEETYTKLIYRLDLEDYYGIRLRNIYTQDTLEAILTTFIDIKEVASYVAAKHEFDSNLGEGVEYFYKWVFPAYWQTDAFPYIDEALGGELVAIYGYKLWLQGLEYDHALVNYYCAYRLMEYYDIEEVDEIILELASCQLRTQDIRVKAACNQAIQILSRQKEGLEPVIFTQFKEGALQGGQTLYGIVNQKLVTIASWAMEEDAGFKVLATNVDKDMAFIKVHTKTSNYYYVIPIDSNITYDVAIEGVSLNGKIIAQELSQGMLEKYLGDAQEETLELLEKVEGEWLLGDLVQMTIGDTPKLVYDVTEKLIMTVATFNEIYDTTYLVRALKEQFANVEESRVRLEELIYTSIGLDVDGERIWVREYTNALQRNVDMLNPTQASLDLMNSQNHVWTRGRLVISYNGSSQTIIQTLEEIVS